MDKFAQLPMKDQRELFSRVGRAIKIHEAIVEKDFWVCWVLDALFSSPRWRDKMIFKTQIPQLGTRDMRKSVS